MNEIKICSIYRKSIWLLGNNQNTSNVESGLTKTEIKYWVELLFGVKVEVINSHRLSEKKVEEWDLLLGSIMHFNIIIAIQPGSSIPPRKERS